MKSLLARLTRTSTGHADRDDTALAVERIERYARDIVTPTERRPALRGAATRTLHYRASLHRR